MSTTRNHPPIPPNCPEFKTEQVLGIYFELPSKMRIFLHCFDDKNRLPMFRKIIAAVARCAWMDVAVQLAQNSHCTEEEMRGHIPGIDEAIMNAEAWRIWGLTKAAQCHSQTD